MIVLYIKEMRWNTRLFKAWLPWLGPRLFLINRHVISSAYLPFLRITWFFIAHSFPFSHFLLRTDLIVQFAL